jgi:hypothetical protein
VTDLTVSKPTFLELSNALAKAGRLDLLNEDGAVECGNLTITTADAIPQASRLAAAMDDAAAKYTAPCEAAYADEDVEVHVRHKADGIHVIERRPGLEQRVVTMPTLAVPGVIEGLVESLVKPAI